MSDLNSFLMDWDAKYKEGTDTILLFKKDLISQWSLEQRQYFIRIFYHSRGHFNDFLWHLGNFAPDKKSKDMVLENISEEFNGSFLSHEQLYLNFALREGVDLSREYIDNQYNIKKIKRFNDTHMCWLYAHSDWYSKLSAFSAYERLDSVDYELLSQSLFESSEKEPVFFTIHRKAKHFEKTHMSLKKAWQDKKSLVEEAFIFIAEAQLEMWKYLYSAVASYPKKND